jgi:deazaflavin-dependent oxidoreductase (nitroreductase family)
MDLRRGLIGKAANTLTVWAIRAGIPRPPYTRANALIIETTGRRSGRRRRIPVGYIEEDGKQIVVVEDGARADWVRNAQARGGRLRVFYRGAWRDARLQLIEGDPESYLQRMNRAHAMLVRHHSSVPGIAQITLL